MQVIFVGGASGVGASCLAIELANSWIVVDAGVRVDRKADPLPDLALLEGKDIRAIFVTHAHADHIGALPLVHRAFPTVPIYASRATGLLMEVMLADALHVMERRAVEEMEIPLYPRELVGSMLNQVRPLPIGEPVTLPHLPNITIHASRAGHIAGAVSLGFVAPEGSLVVSGDISITPQRTVTGAVAPPITNADLVILESTYGARLHPNRQAEELRLAQAVAEGISEGGHVLIPCFGLGRGQELLLLLRAAQEKGQIPPFPLYVDGLVRRVCSTYLLMPEALAPTLQRQIRKGYLPFRGSNIDFVRDERDREQILAGPPACIVSSSGMLTGGPSVWYATRLAPDPKASILITGYQDEEAPGKRLLDLAEQRRDTLELNGQHIQVHCRVAKYSLSAHADGGELANYAASLRPRRVALVHGDEDARNALRMLLSGTEVLLPQNGSSLEHGTRRARQTASSSKPVERAEPALELPTLPIGIGNGAPFTYDVLEEVWNAVSTIPTLRIITARELALVWYGTVTEEQVQDVIEVLEYDLEQHYFVRQHALEEAYRVRGQAEEASGDFFQDLVGSIILLQMSGLASTKPALCRSIEGGAWISVQLPRSESDARNRYPNSSIIEVLGPLPQEVSRERVVPDFLEKLRRDSRRIRRKLSAHELARQCQEEATYTLSELCWLAGLTPDTLEERLAVAKLLHKNPLLFTQRHTVLDGEGQTLYGLAPEWEETLQQPEVKARPDQNWIIGVIEQYIGTPPDLYRKSSNPETGDVVLSFHFPAIAHQKYSEALASVEEETGVSISISPHPHQGELTRVARECIPPGLTLQGNPSVYHDPWIVEAKCKGQVSEEAMAEAVARFREITGGWQLQLIPVASAAPKSPSTLIEVTGDWREPVAQHVALQMVQERFGRYRDFYRAGAESATTTLVLRFHFPAIARDHYAEELAELEAATGWSVRLHPTVHQEAVVKMALSLLPTGMKVLGTPSIHQNQRRLILRCNGMPAPEIVQQICQRFSQETGWILEIIAPEL